MKKLRFLLLGIVLSALVVSQAGAQWFVFENPLLGKKAVDFSLKNVNGKEKSLSSLRGDKAAIVFFWATWCPHCRGWISEIGRRTEDFKAKNIQLIMVDLQEGPVSVQRYLDRNNINQDVLLDREGSAAGDYGVQGIPTFVFIGTDGIVKAVENELPRDYERILFGE